MKYTLYFPYPVKHQGLFESRYILISELLNIVDKENFKFSRKLPNAEQIFSYLELVKRNVYSKEYLGELLTDQNKWKWVSIMADFQNLYFGLDEILINNINRAYFMTGTGGHHANNQRYELFSPLNTLFFIVEYLNYFDNFPNIIWIDIDAHFGNGDKEIFDSYVKKMGNETNNLQGFSFHNDSGNIDNVNQYKGVYYPTDILDDDFINLQVKNINFSIKPKYLLLFFGTDIFVNDYGDNLYLSTKIIPQIVDIYEELANRNNSKLIIIQTGGTLKKNYELLINEIASR